MLGAYDLRCRAGRGQSFIEARREVLAWALGLAGAQPCHIRAVLEELREQTATVYLSLSGTWLGQLRRVGRSRQTKIVEQTHGCAHAAFGWQLGEGPDGLYYGRRRPAPVAFELGRQCIPRLWRSSQFTSDGSRPDTNDWAVSSWKPDSLQLLCGRSWPTALALEAHAGPLGTLPYKPVAVHDALGIHLSDCGSTVDSIDHRLGWAGAAITRNGEIILSVDTLSVARVCAFYSVAPTSVLHRAEGWTVDGFRLPSLRPSDISVSGWLDHAAGRLRRLGMCGCISARPSAERAWNSSVSCRCIIVRWSPFSGWLGSPDTFRRVPCGPSRTFGSLKTTAVRLGGLSIIRDKR